MLVLRRNDSFAFVKIRFVLMGREVTLQALE
jgi:hypothetical protein